VMPDLGARTYPRRLAKLEAILPSATAEETALIAALLSIPTGDRYPPLGLSPQQQRRKTLDALLTRTFGTVRRATGAGRF
jgi:hypothetical protein